VSCLLDDRAFDAVVDQVSLTGVRMVLNERLLRDDIVVVQPVQVHAQLEPVRCNVRWCRKSGSALTAGLAFNEPPTRLSRSWVAVLLHSLGFGPERTHQRRQNLRVTTDLPVRVGRFQLRALDLGMGGLLLDSSETLDVGEVLPLVLGPHYGLSQLDVKGRVVNARPSGYGIEFVDMGPSATSLLGSYVLQALAAASRSRG
ncbi:MAG: PilZ domain-containing protein, partial [Candidatus Eremiobacterota bacterium]